MFGCASMRSRPGRLPLLGRLEQARILIAWLNQPYPWADTLQIAFACQARLCAAVLSMQRECRATTGWCFARRPGCAAAAFAGRFAAMAARHRDPLRIRTGSGRAGWHRLLHPR
jgi:hypothetical protein